MVDLWIVFSAVVVDIFNRVDERFEHLSLEPGYPPAARATAVYQIVEDTAHRHWYGCGLAGLMEVEDGDRGSSSPITGHRFTLHREITVGGKTFDCSVLWDLYADRSGGL